MKSLGGFTLFLVLTAFFTVSCTDGESPVESVLVIAPDEGSEMVLVKASGKKGYVGTSETSAKTLERPQMGIEFTYDFYIGRHEVICKDFNDAMKNLTGASVACLEDSLPAANVSFYDAVLYANERS